MHNSSRRDKGQLKAEKLKTVFIQHTVNKITLSFHFVFKKMLDVKLQDVKQTDEISGHEIAGHENAKHDWHHTNRGLPKKRNPRKPRNPLLK